MITGNEITPTDSQLLDRYLDSKDETAFESIVERYLPLVRGVLWRRLGDVAQVDELAMQIFAALAQKAGDLRQRPSVGGWLVITARQKSAEAQRNAATRSRHMNKLAEHTAAHAYSVDQSNALDDATPHLDDALAALAEGDRDAVIAHFYEGLPYREIGQRIARGEDAARKRVNKALEKMATFLRHRGVTLTGTALAGGLTATLAPTAHGAIPSVAAVSKGALELAGSGNIPVAAAAGTSIAKWALAGAAVFALSTGAGYVTIPRDKPPSEPARAEGLQNNAQGGGAPTAITNNRPAYRTLSPEVAARLRDPVPARLQLAIELWDERAKRASAAYEHERVMKSFTAEEAKEALALMDRDYTYNRDRHMRMSWELIETIVRADPLSGADYAMEQFNSGDPNWRENTRLWKAVDAWASTDPAATREWLAAQNIPEHLRYQMVDNLVRSTSWKDPEAALELLLELPHHKRRGSYGMFQSYDYPELREATLNAVAGLTNEAERAAIFTGSIVRKLETHADVRAAFDRMNFTSGDAVVPALDEILYRALDRNPAELPDAFDLAFDFAPAAAHAHFLDRRVSKWLREDSEAATAWLDSRGLSPEDVAAASASFQR